VLVGPVVPFAAPPLEATAVVLGGTRHDLNTAISQHTRLFNITVFR